MASILKSFSLKRDSQPHKPTGDAAADSSNQPTGKETSVPVSTKPGSASVLKAKHSATDANASKTAADLEPESMPIAVRGVAARIDGNIIGKQNSGSNGLVEFNLDDIAQQGREQIGNARAEVEAMLEAARVEGQQIKAKARKEGHAEGIQAANTEMDKRIAKEAEAKARAQIQSLRNAVMQMRTQYNDWMAQYAEVLTQTSLAAAERLTRQEIRLPNASLLAVQPETESSDGGPSKEPAKQPAVSSHPEEHLLVRWAREALHSTRSAGKLTLAVHPDTLAELGKPFDELLANPDLPEQSVVIPDETLTIGDVVVRQDGGEIRAGLDAQLQRLREELMGDDLPDHGVSR